MTYLAIAASAKKLRDHFMAGIDTFTRYYDQRPATCRAHPDTAALLMVSSPFGIEIVSDPAVARLNLYFGPQPEKDTR